MVLNSFVNLYQLARPHRDSVFSTKIIHKSEDSEDGKATREEVVIEQGKFGPMRRQFMKQRVEKICHGLSISKFFCPI